MELNNLRSFERLTGAAFFNDTSDSVGDIPLGNITMMKNDYQPKTVEIPLSRRGVSVLARRDQYQVSPIFSIDGNQLHSPVIPLLLLGDRNSDLSQSSGSAATFTFTAKAGRAYHIGAYNLTAVVVTVSASAKVAGTDFFIDDPNLPQGSTSMNGIIILPAVAAGIADAATVTVTFNKPSLTMEQYTAFTKLNRSGVLTVYAEDEFGPPAKEIWIMNGTLTVKAGADFDPNNPRKFTFEFSIFGNPTVRKRPS